MGKREQLQNAALSQVSATAISFVVNDGGFIYLLFVV
jgi:hypothetical protein